MKQVDRSHWYFLIPLIILVILGIYQCFTMAHAVNAVDRVQRIYDPANPGDSATVRNDTLNAMALAAIKAVKVRVTQRLEADSIVGSLTSVAIIDDTLWLNRDSTNCVMVVWFVGTGAGIKYNCATDSLYLTLDGSTWLQLATGTGGAGTGDIDAVTAGNGLTGGGTSGSVTVNVLPGWGIKIDNDSVEVNATQLLDSISAVDQDSTFNAARFQRWLPHPSLSGMYVGSSNDSGFFEHVDSTSGNSYTRSWTPIWYWEIVPDSAIPTWGRVNAAIGSAGGGDITGVLANDWITGSASSGDVSLGINPSLLAALYLGGDTTFIDGAFVKIAADTSFVLDLYRGVVTADSAYPTIARVNAAIAASPAGDITNVGVTAPITGGGSSGSVTLGFDWTWLYGFVDTTTATIPRATLADSTTGGAARATTSKTADSTAGGAARATLASTVLFSWLYTFVDTTTAVIPRATLADSCTKYDTTFVDFTELRTEIKNRAEIYNKIDTTSAKIPTASLADSAVKYDTSFVDWTELRAEIKNRAEIWNKIDTTSATIPVATLSNSVLFSWLYTFVDTTTATLPHATFADSANQLTHRNIKPWHLDTTKDYTMNDLRLHGGLRANWWRPDDIDSPLVAGGGGGITIGSNITLGTDITDDTAIVTLASEWAGMVLARGYRDDSTKYWDSVTIRGGSDSYGNYIEFGKLGSDTTGTTPRRRHLQVAIPVPMDADTVYDVALSYRVFDGTGGESTYVRLKWSTTPFDSTNIFKTAYTELDSTNGTTFDTLSAAYARTSVSRGSKIYALVTGLLYDKHVTWIRCYDLIMTYHRRYL